MLQRQWRIQLVLRIATKNAILHTQKRLLTFPQEGWIFNECTTGFYSFMDTSYVSNPHLQLVGASNRAEEALGNLQACILVMRIPLNYEWYEPPVLQNFFFNVQLAATGPDPEQSTYSSFGHFFIVWHKAAACSSGNKSIKRNFFFCPNVKPASTYQQRVY